MYEGKPCVDLLAFLGFDFKIIQVKIEYFKEDIIRECSDRHPSATQVSTIFEPWFLLMANNTVSRIDDRYQGIDGAHVRSQPRNTM